MIWFNKYVTINGIICKINLYLISFFGIKNDIRLKNDNHSCISFPFPFSFPMLFLFQFHSFMPILSWFPFDKWRRWFNDLHRQNQSWLKRRCQSAVLKSVIALIFDLSEEAICQLEWLRNQWSPANSGIWRDRDWNERREDVSETNRFPSRFITGTCKATIHTLCSHFPQQVHRPSSLPGKQMMFW